MTIKKSHTLVSWMAVAAMLLTACNGNDKRVVSLYQHVDNATWNSQDSIVFPIDSIAQSGCYRLSVDIRTTSKVPFQKIYVTAEQDYSMPALHRRDTVMIQLTDEAGKIQGKGFNHYCFTAPVKAAVHLRKGQSGQISLSHIMRRTQLSGISDIGITLSHEDCSH